MKFILTQNGMENIDKVEPIIPAPFDIGENIVGSIAESSKESVKEATKEFLIEVAQGIGEFLVDIIGAVALVGSGVLILLRVVGFDNGMLDGYKWAGILITINVLVKYLFGG